MLRVFGSISLAVILCILVPLLLFYLNRRGMAGGPFPQNLNVKKNKFVEEWNGRREITEKSWEANFENVTGVLFYCLLVPYGIYYLAKYEFKQVGSRRYKD